MKMFDCVIIGAGLYGLYAAHFIAENDKKKILVLECDTSAFQRVTYINQARVHQGYHYPRSISTAMKSAGYFARFNCDYDFCINQSFHKIYATSAQYSWSSGEQFKRFCEAADIPCEEVHPNRFFQQNMCDSAFQTREYTYDAAILKEYYLEKLAQCANVKIQYGIDIRGIEQAGEYYQITTEDDVYQAPFVLNATYASTNQVLDKLGFEKFGIKYELCEMSQT